MNDIGMHLRKWRTNHNTLQEAFLKKEKPIDGAINDTTAVLSMQRNTDCDSFEFALKSVIEYLTSRKANTKGHLLKAASSIYEPLGVLSTFTVTAKLLFQQLWIRNIAWDEELHKEIGTTWNKRCTDVL